MEEEVYYRIQFYENKSHLKRTDTTLQDQDDVNIAPLISKSILTHI